VLKGNLGPTVRDKTPLRAAFPKHTGQAWCSTIILDEESVDVRISTCQPIM